MSRHDALWDGRSQAKGSVRPVAVVTLDLDPEHALELAARGFEPEITSCRLLPSCPPSDLL